MPQNKIGHLIWNSRCRVSHYRIDYGNSFCKYNQNRNGPSRERERDRASVSECVCVIFKSTRHINTHRIKRIAKKFIKYTNMDQIWSNWIDKLNADCCQLKSVRTNAELNANNQFKSAFESPVPSLANLNEHSRVFFIIIDFSLNECHPKTCDRCANVVEW